MTPRLLAGPPPGVGTETLGDHLRRLGPSPAARPDLISVLEASGLLGRGGAGFPVGRKWRSVAERAGGDARILANGAEGEPLSAKDRAMMTLRPHLVLDGATLAAEAVGARDIVLYVGSAHTAARTALDRALGERSAAGVGGATRIRIVDAPDAYVAGEESAAVHFVNAGDSRPTTTPPRPFEAGIAGRPTLVQNVESLAQVALIARYGDAWNRELGQGPSAGSGLVTVTGAPQPGVREIELGTTIAELAHQAGQHHGSIRALLLGGYFGSWASRDEAWELMLDPATLRGSGKAFGCGVVSFLETGRCGVEATATIMAYMAGQSAAQCGPCAFGLRAIADTTTRIASGRTSADDLDRVARWGRELVGRGACRHPDGAVGLLASALVTFGDEFAVHVRTGRCPLGEPVRRAA